MKNKIKQKKKLLKEQKKNKTQIDKKITSKEVTITFRFD